MAQEQNRLAAPSIVQPGRVLLVSLQASGYRGSADFENSEVNTVTFPHQRAK